MRGKTRRDWRDGKRRYMIHFSTGSAAMRFYDEQIEVGSVIESGTYEVWRVEQPTHADGLGHAWAKLVAVWASKPSSALIIRRRWSTCVRDRASSSPAYSAGASVPSSA